MIGHWKLQGDCRDYSGNDNHGINHGVELKGDAAAFDGKGSYIEALDSPSLRLGKGDFAIAVWVKCAGDGACVTGDIIGKYDSDSRKGLNFHISASAPAYCSVSDTRNVQFGIDNAIEGTWIDHGRLWPSNTLIGTLIVYKGELYTGIADAFDKKDVCRIFRYAGGTEWVDCGRAGDEPDNCSIMSAVIHKDSLYVGTGTWHYWSVGVAGSVHVYRYEGGKTWHDCGKIGDGRRILSLASYKGDLYASDDTGSVYRYDGDHHWAFCGKSPQFYILSMMVYRDRLYGGSSDTICRYNDEAAWDVIGRFNPASIDQVHTLGVYAGKLYAGTWSDGKIMRYDGDMDWADCGDLGVSDTTVRHEKTTRNNEINDLTVYNGKMYAGVIPKAQLWRYDGVGKVTLIKQLVENPDYSPDDVGSWCRVQCLTIFQGRLYAGTASCTGMFQEKPKIDVGKVFSWEAGKSVSYDHDLGLGWRHLAAVKQGKHLKLYVDGSLAATSSDFDPAAYDLTNNEPLLIGFGAENYFSGSMRDLRIYDRSLEAGEVSALYRDES